MSLQIEANRESSVSDDAIEVLSWPILVLAFAVFAGVLGIYLLTTARNYSQDGMAFTTLITEGNLKNPLFFQAEHLLYPLMGWLWFQLWVFFGYTEGALLPLQILNSLFGAAGITFFFLSSVLTLGRRRESIFFGLVTALALASSYGYWLHSTDVEDQIGSNVLVLLAFLLLLMGLRKDSFSTRRLVSLGAVMALAVLIHATHVLFLPVIFVGLLFSTNQIRRITIALGSFFLAIGIVYLSVGALAHGYTSPADFQAWALAAPGKGVWGKFGLRNFWQGAQTYAESLIYLQGGPNFKDILRGDAAWANLLSIVAFLGTVWISIQATAHGLYHRKRIGRWRMLILYLCLLWAVTYTAFNFYWAPEDVQFWVSAITPMILMFSITYYDTFLAFPKLQEFLKGFFVFGMTAVFLINLATVMVPRADLSTNEGLKQAMLIRDNTAPQDLIIAPGWDWAGSYVPYFSKRRLVTVIDTYVLTTGGDKQKAMSEIKEEISATLQSGGKVYAVRLYNLGESDRDYLNRVTGFTPEDFNFQRELAWRSDNEETWQILGLERGS